MHNELMELNTEQILVQQGIIEWSQFEDLKRQAVELAEHIRTIEVDEENIKQSKKLLAEVNKRCKEIDDRRIKIKNVMLEPYKTFEDQVKEVISIVKEADEVVRQQVKQLDEEERLGKQNLLEDLFNKRVVHYSFRDLFCFGDFLKPKHLNKTTTVDSVEKEMVEFFEKIARDMHAIEQLPNGKSVLRHYLDTKDLAKALTLQMKKEEQDRRIEQAQAQANKKPDKKIEFLVSVNCFDRKELQLLTILLDQNGFAFQYTTDQITGGN
jgi:hypothetical protein